MVHVETFFMDNTETNRVREETGDPYIDSHLPHYRGDDGIIRYGKSAVAPTLLWWEPARNNYADTNYGPLHEEVNV